MQAIKFLLKSEAPTDGAFGTGFIQQLSAFGERHKKSRDFSDKKLERYINRKFGQGELEGLSFINLDTLPPAARQFIELQHRISGVDVGRSGMDSFHPEERDGSFGSETTAQRLKREGRENWWRWFLTIVLIYTRHYEDTYKMLRNAKEATEQARQIIDIRDKSLVKSTAGILMQLKRDKKEHFLKKQEKENLEETLLSNEHSKERLKQEKEDLKEYEEKVIKPAEDNLNNTIPTDEKLDNIQTNIIRTIPGRAWRIFETLMQGMKNQFNSFPRMQRKESVDPEEREIEPTPVYSSKPKAPETINEQDILEETKTSELGSANEAEAKAPEKDEDKPEPEPD